MSLTATDEAEKATLRPGMADPGGWQPTRGDLLHPRPRHVALLASARERASPMPDDEVVEGRDLPRIGRHGVVREIAARHLTRPVPLFGHRHVTHAVQRLLDLDESGSHPLGDGVPHQSKPSSFLRLSADVREAEIERLRFPPTPVPTDAPPHSARTRSGGSCQGAAPGRTSPAAPARAPVAECRGRGHRAPDLRAVDRHADRECAELPRSRRPAAIS